jgi:hypothetical protein
MGRARYHPAVLAARTTPFTPSWLISNPIAVRIALAMPLSGFPSAR